MPPSANPRSHTCQVPAWHDTRDVPFWHADSELPPSLAIGIGSIPASRDHHINHTRPTTSSPPTITTTSTRERTLYHSNSDKIFVEFCSAYLADYQHRLPANPSLVIEPAVFTREAMPPKKGNQGSSSSKVKEDKVRSTLALWHRAKLDLNIL